MSFQTDELSFDEGDTLYILDMSNTDWWKAKCGNNTGLIPSNYGEQRSSQWLFKCQIFLSLPSKSTRIKTTTFWWWLIASGENLFQKMWKCITVYLRGLNVELIGKSPAGLIM